MYITEEITSAGSIIRLYGSLDLQSTPAFRQQLGAGIQAGTRSLIVDCRHLEYIASAGLRALADIAVCLKRHHGRIVLCSLKGYLRKVFEMTGLDRRLPIEASLDEALASLETGGSTTTPSGLRR